MARANPIAAACLGLALVLAGCEEAPVEREPVVRPVKVHTIGSLDAAAIREYPGEIRAFQNAEMGFEVGGRITEFLVREGDAVTRGEVLARLDARDYEAQLKASEADVRKAQSDFSRSESIFKQDPGAISKETIDRDKRAVEVAEARLDVSRKAFEDTELRAPFSGLMARKLVDDFANVQAKEAVLILQDNTVLEIQINVPERDIARGRTGESSEQINERIAPVVVVSALPDLSFPARIKEMATTADPVTRTFPAKLTFDNPADVNILPGMTARIRVIVDPEHAWSVPATAAQVDEAGSAYVWKIDPDSMKVARTAVELGELSGDRVRVASGLQEGDLVAVSGATLLREGMQVRRYER